MFKKKEIELHIYMFKKKKKSNYILRLKKKSNQKKNSLLNILGRYKLQSIYQTCIKLVSNLIFLLINLLLIKSSNLDR